MKEIPNTILDEFVNLSRRIGERFDLVQAAGGNTSVKHKNLLAVKASGVQLSDMSSNYGYSIVDNNKVLEMLKSRDFRNLSFNSRELIIEKKMEAATVNKIRASIETFLHSLFYKFTVHTHPIVIMSVLCSKNSEEFCKENFKDSIYVNYFTPGYDLAQGLVVQYENFIKKHEKIPKIVFLENHGLIVSADTSDEVLEVQDSVLGIFESSLNFDLSKYKFTNDISALYNKVFNREIITMLCEDTHINNYLLQDDFRSEPLFPDYQVYCGYRILELQTLNEQEFIKYFKKFEDYPKILIYKKYVFICGLNYKKCKESEDVLKAYILCQHSSLEKQYISESSLSLLSKMNSEKYRKNLK